MAREARTAGVVTPEAVPLEFEAANVGSRGVAFLLDALLLFGVASLLNVGVALVVSRAGRGLPGWVVVTVVLVLNFLWFFGYPIALETLWRGRTLGKAAMGLRVVTLEGAPVGFRHAAIRAALGLVDFWITLGAGAVVSALVTRRHQRLGDLVAGTIVLRERTGAGGTPSAARFEVPSGAESYAATLDPSGLRADDYDTLRTFLLRAATLPDDVRRDLAARLAGGLSAKVRHDPASTVHPELFLLCLAARYQQRGAGYARAQATSAPPEVAGGGQEKRGFTPPT